MTLSLNIGLWNATKLHITRINNVNLKEKVIELKTKIMELLNSQSEVDDIELMYCGILMENEKRLSCYIQNECTLYILFKDKSSILTTNMVISDDDLQIFVSDFKNVMLNPAFINMISNVSKPVIMNKLTAAVPDLLNDHEAYSIVQDPDLLMTIIQPAVMKTVAVKHPSLLHAANYLIKDILNDIITDNIQLSPQQLTDDEFSESDVEMDFPDSQIPVNTNHTYTITAAQVTAAIENVLQNQNTESTLMNRGRLGAALRGIINQHRQIENGERVDSNHVRVDRFQSQLQQMHELGLSNDVVNLRALHIAGGDIQTAVELVLNGVAD